MARSVGVVVVAHATSLTWPSQQSLAPANSHRVFSVFRFGHRRRFKSAGASLRRGAGFVARRTLTGTPPRPACCVLAVLRVPFRAGTRRHGQRISSGSSSGSGSGASGASGEAAGNDGLAALGFSGTPLRRLGPWRRPLPAGCRDGRFVWRTTRDRDQGGGDKPTRAVHPARSERYTPLGCRAPAIALEPPGARPRAAGTGCAV